MKSSEIGMPIHPMKSVKNPATNQKNAHATHQMIQKTRTLLVLTGNSVASPVPTIARQVEGAASAAFGTRSDQPPGDDASPGITEMKYVSADGLFPPGGAQALLPATGGV